MGGNTIIGNQCVTNISNLNFSHFWARKCNTLVKLTASSLIICAVPFCLSDIFFLLFFQTAISANTILWIVSRFLAARSALRFMLSWRRLRSRSQCMLSIAQCCLVIWLSRSALLSRLEMYSRCSDVLLPSEFFSVDVSISMYRKSRKGKSYLLFPFQTGFITINQYQRPTINISKQWYTF